MSLPKQYSSEEREAIAAEIVSFVRQRTLQGKDFEGSSFPKYSPEYIKSVDFRAAGKSRSKVNLTLSGDMLAFLGVVKNTEGEIVLGYDDDSPQAGKAEGNQIGSYGQSSGDSSKARRFLGITKDDLQKILRKYPLQDDEEREARAQAVLDAQENIDEFVDTARQEGIDETDPRKLASKFKLKIGK